MPSIGSDMTIARQVSKFSWLPSSKILADEYPPPPDSGWAKGSVWTSDIHTD